VIFRSLSALIHSTLLAFLAQVHPITRSSARPIAINDKRVGGVNFPATRETYPFFGYFHTRQSAVDVRDPYKKNHKTCATVPALLSVTTNSEYQTHPLSAKHHHGFTYNH
jgi:hypothetical protein